LHNYCATNRVREEIVTNEEKEKSEMLCLEQSERKKGKSLRQDFHSGMKIVSK